MHDVQEKPRYTVADWLIDQYLRPIVAQTSEEARKRAEREREHARTPEQRAVDEAKRLVEDCGFRL